MLSEATNLIAENCILLFYQMGAEDPFSWTLSAPVKEMMKLFSLKPSFATEIHWVWHQSDFRVFNRPHHLVSLKNLCCGKGDEVIVIWFFCIKKKKKKNQEETVTVGTPGRRTVIRKHKYYEVHLLSKLFCVMKLRWTADIYLFNITRLYITD